MLMRRLAMPCLLWTLFAAGTTHAYTGGPMLVDVLGWDRRAHRVYFHSIPANESYSFGAVYFFELGGKNSQRRSQLAWSIGDANADDADRTRRLQTLRRSLMPLVPTPESSLGWGVEVLSTDTIPSPSSAPLRRFKLRLASSGLHFEFTGYHRPDACIKDVYSIPDRTERLYVVTFRGNSRDMAETQVPVLVARPSDRVLQVVWEPDK